MTHLDRLRELVYISPSGKEHRPLWDTLERSGGKKAALHELPGLDVAAVQDLGNQATHWPLDLYFPGADCDIKADAFYAALREKGRAKLKHPRWGDLDVLALTWTQSEDMLEGLRVVRFKVEFVHFPDLGIKVTANTASAIQSATDTASTAASAANAAQMVTTTAQDLARMKNKITRNLRSTMNKLKSIAGAVDSVRSTIEAAGKLIEGSIDTLTETPLELAQSVISLLRAPARVVSGIKSKVEGYRSLITTACADIYGLVAGGAYAATANELMGLWLAIIDSTTEGTLSSRGEAVAAREALLSSIARLEAAIDYLQARGYQPDAQVLAMLADLKAQAAGYLLESAYSLPSERVKVLSAASHPLELAHELYGSADEAARLIAENGWGGDMILSLPVGTEVHYYA